MVVILQIFKLIFPRSILVLLLCGPVTLFAQQEAAFKKEWILDEKIGDLDRDGMEERVVVVSIQDSSGKGVVRELRILKKIGRDWIVWKRSAKAILPLQEGGILGDPFEYIEIEKGSLLVRQSGGNAWKWGQTDKYRFQNGAFELVGYTSFYGRPCEYWAAFNFDISGNKVVYTKAYEQCSMHAKAKKEKEHFKFRLKKRITLETRYENYTSITSPKLKQEIVF